MYYWKRNYILIICLLSSIYYYKNFLSPINKFNNMIVNKRYITNIPKIFVNNKFFSYLTTDVHNQLKIIINNKTCFIINISNNNYFISTNKLQLFYNKYFYNKEFNKQYQTFLTNNNNNNKTFITQIRYNGIKFKKINNCWMIINKN